MTFWRIFMSKWRIFMTFLSWEVVGNADVETTNGQVSRPNGYLTTIFLPLTMYKKL